MLSLRLKGLAEVGVRVGIVRREFDSAPQMGQGLVPLLAIREQVAEVVVGLIEVGEQTQRLFVLRDRLVVASLVGEEQAEVVVRLGQRGVQTRGLFIVLNGAGQVAAGLQRVGEVVVGLGEGGIRFDCAPEAVEGLVELSPWP